MGQLKPVGSEKLVGDEKMKRILELTYYQMPKEKTVENTTIKESVNGIYGITKEKDGFYVKKGINENSLDYIGGLFMKNKNRFSSYNEALKKMEFLVEQEKLTEATKYVLKQPKPKIEPAPVEDDELPPMEDSVDDVESPSKMTTDDEISDEDFSSDEFSDEVEGDENEDDYLKTIQKYTGKLTQKLMSVEDKIQSDDIKYVINMVLSSVDLSKLDESDIEDIIEKIENPDDESMGEPETEMDDVESDELDQLEELINKPLDEEDEPTGLTHRTEPPKTDVDLNQEMDEEIGEPELSSAIPVDDEIKELDINELSDIVNTSVKETLSKYFNT